MTNKMFFSIIVPIYNTELYLNKCLDSLVRQTCTDFEVLLVNDGSTDKSPCIALRYAKRFKNFKYYSQNNKGLGSARDLGLRNSNGYYILFLDSDDYLDINSLKNIKNLILSNNSPDCIVTKPIDYDEKNNIFTDWNNDTLEIKKIFAKTLHVNVHENPFVQAIEASCWRIVFKNDLIKKFRISFLGIRYFEDINFRITAFHYANSIMYNDCHKFYYYRINSHSSQITNIGNNTIAKTLELLKVCNILSNKIHKEKWGIKERASVAYLISKYMVWFFNQALKLDENEQTFLALHKICRSFTVIEICVGFKFLARKKSIFLMLLLRNFLSYKLLKSRAFLFLICGFKQKKYGSK